MKHILTKEYLGVDLTKEDLSIGEESINDTRIGWSNTHHILTNCLCGVNYIEELGAPQCIGWCSIED
jgi:hypothetical protein